MGFLLDVNLSPKLIWEFQRLGHACDHVATALDRNAKDREIIEFANRTSMILVSKDADFIQFSSAGLLHMPLIWLRCGNMTAKDTCALLRRRLADALAAIDAGLLIVEIRQD